MNAKAPILPPISASNWLACPGCGLLFQSGDGASRCPVCRQKSADASEPRWYYAHNKQKHGPVSRSELRRLASSGGLHPDDMLLADGSRTWVAAKSLEGLFPAAAIPLRPSSEPSTVSLSATSSDMAATTPYVHTDTDKSTRKLPSVPGYEILSVLGRGGMGVVYKARQVALKRLVALKMILSAEHAGDEALARFKIEAEAVARLRHPYIVQVFESGNAAGHPYLALEFIEGGTLSQKLAGTPLAAREAAVLCQRLAEGMQAAHAAGVVHRDLKPQNVLLDGGSLDHPKIADFGLAKTLDDDSGRTRTGQVMGTPSYMSPEQADGHLDQIGARTDVYALGAILYELLTGRPPFRGTSPLDTLEQVRTQDPVPPSHLSPTVPRDLEAICLKCLEKQSHKRYASAQALSDDLGRFLSNRPTIARPTTSLENAWKFARRNKVVVGVVVALLFATIISTISAGVARFQTAEAKKQEDEAKKQEREAKKQLHAAHVATLKLHQQTGQHRQAIKLADEILAEDCDDKVEIRLQKLESLMAVSAHPKAVEEVAILKKMPLGDKEGRIKLVEVELDRKGDLKERTTKINEAIKMGLPPGDNEYAQALIAESDEASIRLLNQAIEKNPYHYTAHQVLAMLLMIVGRSAPAREIAIRGQTLFPEDPTFLAIRAECEALDGNADKARALVESARPQMGDEMCDLLKIGFEALIKTRDWEGLISDILEGKQQEIVDNLWQRLAPAAEKIMPWMAKQGVSKDPSTVQFDKVFSLPIFMRKSLGITVLPPMMLGGEIKPEVLREVRKTAESNKEATSWFVLGMMLTNQGTFIEASEAYEKAGQYPCFGASFRRPAIFFGMMCEVAGMADKRNEADHERLKSRAAEHLRAYLQTDRPIKPVEGTYLSLIARRIGNPEASRLLLLRWAESDPGNQALPAFRMEVEYLNDNFTEAFKLARDLVKAHPDDKRAQEIRDKSLEKLQKIARGG
jgi:serine/threonine protein kinase